MIIVRLAPTCGQRGWQFERVPGKELRGNDDRVVNQVESRRDCIEVKFYHYTMKILLCFL